MTVTKTYKNINGVRIIESKGKKLNDASYILDKLKCSIIDSEKVVEYDKLTDSQKACDDYLLKHYEQEEYKKKAPKPKKLGIEIDDLTFLLDLILKNFKAGERFKNAELAKLQTRFTNRQTPSRLKKLVDNGELKAEGTPKNYYYE